MAHTFNPCTPGGRVISEFEISLVYILSFRPRKRVRTYFDTWLLKYIFNRLNELIL